MGNWISRVFMFLTTKYGIIVALVIVAILVGIFLLAYYFKQQIDLKRQEEANRETERSRQAKVAEAALAKRETKDAEEKEYQRTRIEKMDSEIKTFLTNHLEHTANDRERLHRVLTDISVKDQAQIDALHMMVAEQREHRVEERGRAKDIHEKLNGIHGDIREVLGGQD